MVDVATMLGAEERAAQADMEKALAFETKLAQVGEFCGEVDSSGRRSEVWMWKEFPLIRLDCMKTRKSGFSQAIS